MSISELIKTIAKEICEKPDQVEVKEIEGDMSSIIEIHVAKEDQGKMIGKMGKVIQAIRTIVYTISFKYNKRYTIEVIATRK